MKSHTQLTRLLSKALKVWPGFSLLYGKMREERDQLKKLLSKKESEPENREKYQPIHIAKK